MTFVALPADPVSPDSSVVQGDGWWPDMDCNAMRDALRITDLVTHPRLVAALAGGLVTIGRELESWRIACELDGATSLAEVKPDQTIAGQHRLTLLFTRAVRFAAAAELAELHRDLTATQDGQARADTQATTADEYNRLATLAVRDILQVPRTVVELI